MTRKNQIRLLIILAVCLASGILLYREKINLGLDLQGGIHLVLQVNTSDALEAEANQVRERVETDLQEREIPFQQISVANQAIQISGVPQSSQGELESYLRDYEPGWEVSFSYREGMVDAQLEMSAVLRKSLANLSVRQARDIIQNRVDQYGVAEPTITVYGSGDVQDQIIVELPGVEDFDRVVNLIRSTARLEMRLVHPTQGGPFPTREAALAAHNGRLPDEYEILPYRDRQETEGRTMYMVVRKAASISGQHLKNARRSQDSFTGKSEVSFFLNPEGVSRFTRVTGENVGNRLAIVLDDEVRSAPVIESRIDTESARITGNFTPQQAEDLALILRSGALPAGITILENRTVGPSLGRDSIIRGIYASILGMSLVMLGMLVVYRFSGVNAILCLLINLLILMGIMAYFHATLTLPGIAGIILTIGMAVDANILIFERIKEELRLGKTVRAAVDAGFGRVFFTIIDTNLTTLIAALFLFQFGTGPVRGFAVTLAVGLLANIFTATFVSRTFFNLVLQRWEVKRLSI